MDVGRGAFFLYLSGGIVGPFLLAAIMAYILLPDYRNSSSTFKDAPRSLGGRHFLVFRRLCFFNFLYRSQPSLLLVSRFFAL